VTTTDQSASDSLRERVAEKLAVMPPAERRVAEYLRDHVQEIIFATAEEIGAATETSDATVVRTAKTLGYSGLPELKRGLGQQIIGGTRPSVRLINAIERVEQETAALLDYVFSEAEERLAETRRLIQEQDFVTAVDLVAGARQVVSFGLGGSELPSTYLALRLCRLGRSARAIYHTGFRLADDLIGLREGDVVVLYAPARLIRDMVVLVERAGEVGAAVILITDSLGPTLADRVTVSLPSVLSGTGISGEGLSALLVTDCLMAGVATRDRDRANSTSELLNSLRATLAPDNEERRRQSRRRREQPGETTQ
jgi:DNA-binding MurR/RpiR family transcriptional regulator